MPLSKRYEPSTVEPRLGRLWQESGVYHFRPDAPGPVYSIDTPPPTVSGFLHLGNVYSYSHADFITRFQRMRGANVYYPMGYDDNGLPTERLVERRTGQTAEEMGRQAFIERCLETSRAYEADYEALWQRLGLSIDWRYTYRTIDDLARRTSQQAFLDLLDRDLVYREKAPTIWCPVCHTAIAQAEVNDLERQSEMVDLAFTLDDGATLPIATTRPELLAACVAVVVHPGDRRYQNLAGGRARVPIFDQSVPVIEDARADPGKGTGAVMCCTFGDTLDVEWWRLYSLELREAVDRGGHLTDLAGVFSGLPLTEARRSIVQTAEQNGVLLRRQPVEQTVRVHERCDTPVEYIVTRQWFVRVLDRKEALIRAGEQASWHPEHMLVRYREWVRNLSWDWCISRQRYYGIAFPIWFCSACDEVIPADESQLPVDPTVDHPPRPCSCGCSDFQPEEDVMDTWATSSLTPQIAGRMLTDPELYRQVFPMSLRPQAHEIIRTWAFDTITMSLYRFDTVPWKDVLISGWGLAPEGTQKISKSRGGGPLAPMEMLEKYSADATRYWAASAGPGRDSVISEEKIQAGSKLVTKLWNVARLCERFIEGYRPPNECPVLSPADRWILSRVHRLIHQVTDYFESYEYAAAKNDLEGFFWRDLADNYVEMAKKRLYDTSNMRYGAARYTLFHTLLTTVKLFAPLLPYVTDEIYRGLFAEIEDATSVHGSRWPVDDGAFIDDLAEAAGDVLVEVATATRRYKSERQLSLGAELPRLVLTVQDEALARALQGAEDDIAGVTRARRVEIGATMAEDDEVVYRSELVSVVLG